MPLLRLLIIPLVATHLYFHSYTVLWLFVFLGIALASFVTFKSIREIVRS